MREILFRGKRVDNGEWVEGLLFTYNGKHCIQLEGIECHDYGLYPRCYAEVIPESVSEFTSLTDKNGKKIFEGDIVKFGDISGIINYSFGCYCVKTNKPDWKSRNNPAIDIVFNEYPNEIEVIGNITDTPELLKGETNA